MAKLFLNKALVGAGAAEVTAEFQGSEWLFSAPLEDCIFSEVTFFANCPVEVQSCGVNIKEETNSPGDGTVPVRNPARITRLFAPVFEATLNPSGCPVTWSIVSGGGTIQGSNTSPLVTVRGDSVSTVVLRATTAGGIFKQISVPVENQKVVEVRVWIVRRNDGTGAATTSTRVNNHLADANKIWEQCGIKFQLVGGIQFINNETFLTPNATQRVDLRNTHMGTSGIEIYYVDSFSDVAFAGETSVDGAIVTDAGISQTLAHELGHAMGLDDIGTFNLHLMNGFLSSLNLDVRLSECNMLFIFSSN